MPCRGGHGGPPVQGLPSLSCRARFRLKRFRPLRGFHNTEDSPLLRYIELPRRKLTICATMICATMFCATMGLRYRLQAVAASFADLVGDSAPGANRIDRSEPRQAAQNCQHCTQLVAFGHHCQCALSVSVDAKQCVIGEDAGSIDLKRDGGGATARDQSLGPEYRALDAIDIHDDIARGRKYLLLVLDFIAVLLGGGTERRNRDLLGIVQSSVFLGEVTAVSFLGQAGLEQLLHDLLGR